MFEKPLNWDAHNQVPDNLEQLIKIVYQNTQRLKGLLGITSKAVSQLVIDETNKLTWLSK